MTTDLHPDPIVQQCVNRMGGVRRFTWLGIPERMRPGLARWFLHGVEPGSFLRAVLKNQLCATVGAADEENLKALHDYATFLYCEAPQGSWGSELIYNRWRDAGGIIGQTGERRAAQ
ncbi:MAG: hypothetical protein AB7I42_26470 [Bradyrhizobium sp.]|uniref:hypothetical protein n=1 Tax=Bradyrhizobium sp. TaxID=376 RepID=UPI003D1012CD